MKCLALFGTAFTVQAAHGLIPIRYHYAYGDLQLVDWARGSGQDPLAAIGRELPSNVSLAVKRGQAFKLQFRYEVLQGGSHYTGTTRTMLTFDRTLADGDGIINPALNGSSFRKVRPSESIPWPFLGTSYGPTFSNFQNHLGYEFGDPNSGISCRYKLNNNEAWYGGVFGLGASLRPVGLVASLSLAVGGTGGFRNALVSGFSSQYVCDVSWTADLAPGETYGFGGGETGLGIFVAATNQAGPPGSTVTGNPFTYSNVGAKYNLIGVVPEPSSLLAFGAGALLFIRRRRN